MLKFKRRTTVDEPGRARLKSWARTGGWVAKTLEAGTEYEAVRSAIDLAAALAARVTLRSVIEGTQRNGVQARCVGDECSVGVVW